MLTHQLHGLSSDVSCCILLMSFPSGISKQYYTRIRKQLTTMFHPVFQGNPWKQIFSISGNIVDIAVCIALNFTLSPVDDVTGFQSCTSATGDKEYSYNYSFISTSLSIPACYTADSPEGMPPSCVYFVISAACSHHWDWAGRYDLDKHQELNSLALRQSNQKISRQTQRTTLEKLYYQRSKTFVAKLCGVFIVESYSPALKIVPFPSDT